MPTTHLKCWGEERVHLGRVHLGRNHIFRVATEVNSKLSLKIKTATDEIFESSFLRQQTSQLPLRSFPSIINSQQWLPIHTSCWTTCRQGDPSASTSFSWGFTLSLSQPQVGWSPFLLRLCVSDGKDQSITQPDSYPLDLFHRSDQC